MKERNFKLSAGAILVGALLPISANGQIVAAGYDLWSTKPGDAAFGGYSFKGVPLGTFDFGGSVGVQPTGNTDTILQRTSTIASTLGGSGQAGLLLVALQLESTTQINFGGNGLDNYFVTLQSARGGQSSTGTLNVNFNNPGSGGTFTSSFDVFFDIRKGALNGPVEYSSSLTLTSGGSGTANGWLPTPLVGATLIAGINYHLDGTDSDEDFFPTGEVKHDSTGAAHHITWSAGGGGNVPNPGPPPGTPEPWQYGMVTSIGLGAFTLLRRRRS
jgi:MYXO-CTERM domain-containing protein